MMKQIARIAPVLLAFVLVSCCEPEVKNSFPLVKYDTYIDSFVYDRMPESAITDSAWYPIYEFQVQNTGTDADSFMMTIGVDFYGFRMTKYVEAGQTVTFRTPGPVPDTADQTAQELYYTFFRRDTAFLPINTMNPYLSITYGQVYKGDEGCNTDPTEMQIDPRQFSE